jgi:hypothetical protein
VVYKGFSPFCSIKLPLPERWGELFGIQQKERFSYGDKTAQVHKGVGNQRGENSKRKEESHESSPTSSKRNSPLWLVW